MSERNYTKVSGGSENPRWEPHKSNQPINPNDPPKIEGYYINCQEIKGPNGMFNAHTVQTVNEKGELDEAYDISLGIAVDDILSKITLGSFICIIYKGKQPSKTPGRSYNAVDVFRDDNAIPYNQVKGALLKKSPGITPAAAQNNKQISQNKVANGQKQNNVAPASFDSSDLPF